MVDFEDGVKSHIECYDREYIDDLFEEKNRLLSVAQRDVESLKREINSLKKQLNYSKQKKK